MTPQDLNMTSQDLNRTDFVTVVFCNKCYDNKHVKKLASWYCDKYKREFKNNNRLI